MNAQIRLRKRKTPKGQIECPIGETVKPSFCKRCAYAIHCKNYESYLSTKVTKLRRFERFCEKILFLTWIISFVSLVLDGKSPSIVGHFIVIISWLLFGIGKHIPQDAYKYIQNRRKKK